jgi:hypothetical protein
MKTYLLLIGVAISLAVSAEGQVRTEESIVYHANPVLVRKVQMALRSRGYYHQIVDGDLGVATVLSLRLCVRFFSFCFLKVKPGTDLDAMR